MIQLSSHTRSPSSMRTYIANLNAKNFVQEFNEQLELNSREAFALKASALISENYDSSSADQLGSSLSLTCLGCSFYFRHRCLLS